MAFKKRYLKGCVILNASVAVCATYYRAAKHCLRTSSCGHGKERISSLHLVQLSWPRSPWMYHSSALPGSSHYPPSQTFWKSRRAHRRVPTAVSEVTNSCCIVAVAAIQASGRYLFDHTTVSHNKQHNDSVKMPIKLCRLPAGFFESYQMMKTTHKSHGYFRGSSFV